MRNDRFKSAIAVTGAFLLVLAIGTLGWALLRSDPSSATASASWQDAASGPSGSPTVTPTPDVVVTTPPPTPTPTPTKTSASKKKVIPKPTTTATARAADKPPVVDTSGTKVCLPSNLGTDASRDEVKNALVTAGNREYWQGVVKDPNLTVPLPKIVVPPDLMKAIAWQESGWQSAIKSTDCGMGVMQIQEDTKTDTAKAINNRFGENFDFNKLADNAAIGAAQIEWLIMYIGIYHFGQNFDLDTEAAVGPNGAPVLMLDAVLAAYNGGVGSIEDPRNTLSISTSLQSYANTVKALRTNCVCQNY
jgi:Transglycosylase SLT domain